MKERDFIWISFRDSRKIPLELSKNNRSTYSFLCTDTGRDVCCSWSCFLIDGISRTIFSLIQLNENHKRRLPAGFSLISALPNEENDGRCWRRTRLTKRKIFVFIRKCLPALFSNDWKWIRSPIEPGRERIVSACCFKSSSSCFFSSIKVIYLSFTDSRRKCSNDSNSSVVV